MSIEPDTKDWTWVIEEPCRQCGFDPGGVSRSDIPDLVHENTRGWYDVLADPDFAVRPAPHVWSRLEYACHVRDVHRLFQQRLELMLEQDDPTFANWDQDETALAERYWEQDPAVVATEVTESGADLADAYTRVGEGDWARTGARSNGSTFTVDSLGRYLLHDLFHHVWDVRG